MSRERSFSVGSPSQQVLSDIRDSAALRQKEMVFDLEALVEHETPSDDVELLAQGHDFVVDLIERRLGRPDHITRTAGGAYGDTSVLEYASRRGGERSEAMPEAAARARPDSRVVILTHYDTVWPKGTIEEFPFRVDGDAIRGPGVFDMKAGTVQVLHALTILRDLDLACPHITWVVSGDEEIGSPASRAVIEAASEGATAVLVFEASAGGALKTARKGVGVFSVALSGLASHAGLDIDRGASAVLAARQVIDQLIAIQDRDSGTTVNVGTINGGTRINVVPESCVLGVDVRISQRSEMDRITRSMAGITSPDERVTVRVDGGWNRPPMERTAAIAELFERYRSLAQRLGTRIAETSAGGASDGNFAAALGVPVLDGLGAVGDGAHARGEYASRAGLTERTALAAALVTSLAG